MVEAALLDDARFDPTQRELLQISWRMLHAIHTGDAHAYAELSMPDLSCYEDVCPYRIDGLEFHLALIQQTSVNSALKPARFDMLTPRVQVYGDTGIVTYTRLMTYDEGGRPRWTTFNETRVFVRQDGAWKMAHFHRTPT
jgi:ketosteroid isomerase-like protein